MKRKRGRPVEKMCACGSEGFVKNSIREWICERCHKIESKDLNLFPSDYCDLKIYSDTKRKLGRPQTNFPQETFKLCRA